MPGRTLTGYAPACLAPEANCATSAVAACVRYNPIGYRLTLQTAYSGKSVSQLAAWMAVSISRRCLAN